MTVTSVPPTTAPVLGESDATEKKGKAVGGAVNCWPLSVIRSAADCAPMYGGKGLGLGVGVVLGIGVGVGVEVGVGVDLPARRCRVARRTATTSR